MAATPQVHWHEGLFLQPQHIQLFQRQVLEQGFAARRLSMSYPYGVVAGRVAPDALENLIVRFEQLRVIMPSGLEVSVPDNAELPALGIEEVFNREGAEPFIVSLGVPLWHTARANTLDMAAKTDHRSTRLYRVAETPRRDENTGQNEQPVLVRRINARLMLETDDRTDMELLPLLRVVPSVSDQGMGVPRADPEYIGPTLLLSGSPTLSEKVRELYNHLEARRRELLAVMSQGAFKMETLRGDQFAQFARLRIYNHYTGRLPHLMHAPAATPFDIYLELRGLLGELAALYPDKAAVQEAAAYDHDNPAVPFTELFSKIRNMVVGVDPPIAKIDFVRDGRWLVARMEEKHLTQPSEYFLALKSRVDPNQLLKLVEDPNKFKLMPRSEVELNIYGVRLQAERFPPLQLPAQVGLTYYRLNRAESGRMWDKIRQQREMAIKWPPQMDQTDTTVALYMTLPSAEAAKA